MVIQKCSKSAPSLTHAVGGNSPHKNLQNRIEIKLSIPTAQIKYFC